MSEVAGRALDLLERVAAAKEPLGLMALAASCGIDKTTASRLLRFLEERGMVLRDPATQRYQVGPALMILAATTMGRSDLLVASRPHFPLLREMTGETVTVHLRVGLERVCLGGLESERQIRSAVTSGERRELFRGASGKTIMAYLPEPDLARALETASQEGCDPEALMAELREIRMRGGKSGASDRIAGLSAISVPIFGVGAVIGALTVSGPSHRWSDDQMTQFFPHLMQVAGQISAALGSPIAPFAARREAPTASPAAAGPRRAMTQRAVVR